MPRYVRNFWLEGHVDGCRTSIAAGPRAKDGGFLLRVKMRDAGAIHTALTIQGDYDDLDDTLSLRVRDAAGRDIETVVLPR